jgi:hypothetical protein
LQLTNAPRAVSVFTPMTFRWIASACLLLHAAGCASQTAGLDPGDPTDLNVLFIGNSLTYTNDLPAIFEALAEAEGVAVSRGVVAFPNVALEDHWSLGDARSAIARGGWDVVVLQQGPSSLPENRANLIEWSGRFAAEIRSAGARPALYMVWPASTRPGDFDAVSESYRQAAAAVDGFLVPGGEAWRAAWRRDPSLGLYGPDGFHPSAMGSYLVALTMLEELAGRSSTRLPDLGLGVPATTRALLAEAAHEAAESFGR